MSAYLEEASSDRHLSFDSDVAKCQWIMHKIYKEKKELEQLNDQLKTQLAMVWIFKV